MSGALIRVVCMASAVIGWAFAAVYIIALIWELPLVEKIGLTGAVICIVTSFISLVFSADSPKKKETEQ